MDICIRRKKINELLKVSNENVDMKKPFHEGLMKKMQVQDNLMKELKVLARQNNTLLGRIIKFPCADSYAVYVITKVNKNTVKIDWVDYCDGWQDDRVGISSNINIDYAINTVKGEDMLDKLFSLNKNKVEV